LGRVANADIILKKEFGGILGGHDLERCLRIGIDELRWSLHLLFKRYNKNFTYLCDVQNLNLLKNERIIE